MPLIGVLWALLTKGLQNFELIHYFWTPNYESYQFCSPWSKIDAECLFQKPSSQIDIFPNQGFRSTFKVCYFGSHYSFFTSVLLHVSCMDWGVYLVAYHHKKRFKCDIMLHNMLLRLKRCGFLFIEFNFSSCCTCI